MGRPGIRELREEYRLREQVVRLLLLLWLLLLWLLSACQSEAPLLPGELAAGTAEATTQTLPPPAATVDVTVTPAATATASPTLLPTATAEMTTATAAVLTATTTVAPEAGETGQPSPLLPVDGIFELFSEEAIIHHGKRADWDGQFTDPGAVVYHDGGFHMFRNGFVGWPAPVAIGYVRSADGFEWTEVGEEPLFSLDDVDYVGYTALASSALVEEDGTWVLYLYTWDRNAPATSAPSKIIRATAPEAGGLWTADEEPVLLPGGEEEWDSLALRAPSVVKTGDRYLMFYSGYDGRRMSIGLATSEDGIHWQKYDDPATTEAPFSESDPVFVAGESGSWDDDNVFQPRVIATPQGLFMIYSSNASIGGPGATLGYAFSTDGLAWTRSEGPVMEHGRIPGGRALWFTELVYNEGTTFLFLEVGLGGESEIFLATRSEPLPAP